MTKRLIFLLTLISLFYSSCFKKEDPIELPDGNTTITTLSLGNEYQNEVYFDLSTNSFMVKQRRSWDIRFEADENGWGVFINTGKGLRLKKLNIHDLLEPQSYDTMNIRMKDTLLDAPDGKPENSAFKDWRQYKITKNNKIYSGIYVLELNYLSGPARYKRVQIDSVTADEYICVFTDLYDGAGKPIVENKNKTIIKKSKTQNYTYYSFEGTPHIVADQEPDRNTWDFVFTRYNHFFYNILPNNQPFPYILNGVLSSKNNVEVAKDSSTKFQDINSTHIPIYTFSKDANAIGYDWKNHAFGAAGTYTVNSKVTYIIKDTDGYYYKMRFLDFYNALGDKGYPKFEFIQIK
ncbi:MAG TPA: HmuY family protein [Bacteroidia bacterium]